MHRSTHLLKDAEGRAHSLDNLAAAAAGAAGGGGRPRLDAAARAGAAGLQPAHIYLLAARPALYTHQRTCAGTFAAVAPTSMEAGVVSG